MSDSSFWSISVPRVLRTYAIVIFVVLWVGFAIALVLNRKSLDLLWNWVRALPSAVAIIVWLLFLPIMAGLGVWEFSLASSCTLVGICRNRRLDSLCCVLLFPSCKIGLLTRARRQTR